MSIARLPMQNIGINFFHSGSSFVPKSHCPDSDNNKVKKMVAALPRVVCTIASATVATAILDARADDKLDVGSTTEPEVIVTAQKREERLQDVPVPVSVISTDALTQ